jgi:hypothetical protein
MKRCPTVTVFILLSLLLSQELAVELNASNAQPLELPNSTAPCGPANNYCEDNDTPGTAYGPLELGVAYQAYPDDTDDYYYFELGLPASVDISVSNYVPTSSNGTVALYGPAIGDEHGPLIDYYGPPGHSSMLLGPHGLGQGKYFIRVYTASDHSTTQLYSLTITAQTSQSYLPLALRNYSLNHLPPFPSFRADDVSLLAGQCTTLRWDFDDIKALYISFGYGYDKEGVPGHGTRQICPSVTSTFDALVIQHDDSSKTYKVTIDVSGTGCGDPVIRAFYSNTYSARAGEEFGIAWDVDCAKTIHLIIGNGPEEPVTGKSSKNVSIYTTTLFKLKVQKSDGTFVYSTFTVYVSS